MLNVQLSKKSFWQNEVEGYIFFIKDGLEQPTHLSPLAVIEQDHYPHLKEMLKKHQFEGKKGQCFSLTAMRDNKLAQFIFVGVGALNKSWDNNLEALRRALASGINTMKRHGIKNAIVGLPEEKYFSVSAHELAKQLAITAHMAAYEFSTFKSDKKNVQWSADLLIAIDQEHSLEAYKLSLEHGNIIGLGINQARGWADLPANHMTPSVLAAEAEKIAAKHNLKKTIFGREKALELGMGGFCAVDAGSDQEGKFVVLEYSCGDKDAPTIALCGKGIMFDTGGINLKPTSGINGMKFDMSGAAAVISMMDIFGTLKPRINVVGLTPLVENMPSGKASRPDDIIICMNGKTVEIQNTDAEGRLVLSDTLVYAEKHYNPAIMIDIATLTGAVQHALGHFYTAVMSKDDQLAEELLELGKQTGDRTWRLPLDEDFNEAIKSKVADIHNNGSSAYYGGTIVGGTFLANFVSKARWAHLDIAGTAHDVPGVNYVGNGATGASIRLLVEFVLKHGHMNQLS